MELNKELFRNIAKVGGKTVAELNVKKATISQWNYRPEHNKEDLEEIRMTLGKSIEEIGLIHLPTCNIKGEIYAGGRRLSAYRVLGIDWMPTIVEEADALRQFMVSFAENKARKDPDWFEDGKKFFEIIKESSISERELAKKLSVSHQYVIDRVNAYEKLKDGGPAGTSITFEQARMIASIPEEVKREELVKMASEGMKTQELKKIIATTNAVKSIIDGEDEDIQKKAKKEFEDQYFTKDLNITKVKWKLEEWAGDSHTTGEGRIWWDLKGIKSTEEAILWFKKYGGRHLEDKDGSLGEWDKVKEEMESEGNGKED